LNQNVDLNNFTLDTGQVPTFELSATGPETYDMALGSAIQVTYLTGDIYEGAYAVVPTQQTQILQTKNKTLEDDVTIAPIPNNYGLITWNGSVLTVS
jgi:hypothetical protein